MNELMPILLAQVTVFGPAFGAGWWSLGRNVDAKGARRVWLGGFVLVVAVAFTAAATGYGAIAWAAWVAYLVLGLSMANREWRRRRELKRKARREQPVPPASDGPPLW